MQEMSRMSRVVLQRSRSAPRGMSRKEQSRESVFASASASGRVGSGKVTVTDHLRSRSRSVELGPEVTRVGEGDAMLVCRMCCQSVIDSRGRERRGWPVQCWSSLVPFTKRASPESRAVERWSLVGLSKAHSSSKLRRCRWDQMRWEGKVLACCTPAFHAETGDSSKTGPSLRPQQHLTLPTGCDVDEIAYCSPSTPLQLDNMHNLFRLRPMS